MASAPSTPKAGWEVKTLGEVVSIQNGYAFKSKNYSDDGHFVMRIGNVQDGYISLDKPKYIAPEKGLERFILDEGDVLVSLTGYIGRAGIIQNEHLPAVLNQRVARVNPKSSEQLTQRFLFLYLSSESFRALLTEDGHGAAQQNVSTKDMALLPFAVPPLAEQERIVGILDEAFEGIAAANAQAEKNLHNARELFQSVLQSTFSQKGDDWVETTLGECGSTQTGSTPKKANPEHYGNHIPFIKPGDFNEDGSLNYENEGLSASGLSVSRLVQETSALMVCIGATIGKSGWCEREITTNQQINTLTPHENLYAKFAYYQFTTSGFQNLVHGSSGQATLPIINKSKWCNLPFVLPPLPTQQAIVEKLDALSEETKALEAIYERKQSALAELKQSLLQKAFAGEL
ncbi:MAG: restriction endonuclease subunit S [Verrucomicrobia bacterium]|nr:restriction endonuclease subunit S [Verrucomicrobiota bacterium]